MSLVDTASFSAGTMDGTGLKKTLRRWKDKWRTNAARSSRPSSLRIPLSRIPSNPSLASPSYDQPQSATKDLPPVPPPPPVPSACFKPTTQTFIHSPADPRNRSRNASTSSISPPGTLRKSRPVSRRQTAPTEFLTNAAPDFGGLPMNVVTTTIVAGNGDQRKRTSRLRLSISRRGSILASSPSSPSLHSQFERSSSRATMRIDERCSSRVTGRFEAVPESEARERVDSDRETLVEENKELIRRPRALSESNDGTSTVELAYQYVGSRDGKKG